MKLNEYLNDVYCINHSDFESFPKAIQKSI